MIHVLSVCRYILRRLLASVAKAATEELSRLLAALGAPILNPEYHEVTDDQREAG